MPDSARMRRWLRDVTGVGTATNDLLFPSGKAEQSDREMERGAGMSPMSREQGYIVERAPGPRKRWLHVSKVVLHRVRTGAVPG